MGIRNMCLVGVAALTILAGCKSNNQVSNEENSGVNRDTATAPAKDTAVAADREETNAARVQIATLVDDWNSAMDIRHVKDLQQFYADEVNFFGQVLSRDELIRMKKDYMAGHPEVQKSIIGNVTVDVHTPTVARASYSRSVHTESGMHVSSGYLMLEKQADGSWKIVAEGDDKQGNGSRREKDAAPLKEKEITSCDKAAEAIFRSSPIVQGMLIQPNAHFKMEHRPGEPDNPNRRYWFWVYGNPPGAPQTETFGRFQVDASTGQLFEYDPVDSKTTVVASNATLKKYLEKYCGK